MKSSFSPRTWYERSEGKMLKYETWELFLGPILVSPAWFWDLICKIDDRNSPGVTSGIEPFLRGRSQVFYSCVQWLGSSFSLE